MCKNAHSSFILNIKKLEIAFLPITRKMDKHAPVYSYNGILCNYFNKRTKCGCSHMGEFQTHLLKERISYPRIHIAWLI